MLSWIKKLFCKHKYQLKYNLPCYFAFMTDKVKHEANVYMYECVKCGKRKVIKSCSNEYYNKVVLDHLKMWSNGEIDEI